MRTRLRGLVLLLAGAGLLVGCAAGLEPDATRSPRADAVRFVDAGDPAEPVVVGGATAVDRAVQASRAFFAASPGVIVAPDGDADAQRRAAEAAERLHVPVLLRSDPATPSPGATPTPEPPGSGRDPMAAEARRLGARWVVGVGAPAPRLTGVREVRLDAARVQTGPAAPPAVALASSTAADTASLATATAAGARVLDLSTAADLVADPEAVRTLAESKEDRVVLIGAAFGDVADPAWAVAAARTGWEYPGGGQRPFDGRLFVALYGTPGTPSLGVLGRQGPRATVDRVRALVKDYEPLVDRRVAPVLEVIATVASGSATGNGDYSGELDVEALEPYVDDALAAGVPVLLDLQPGRADFLTQAKGYASLLERPGVGLALDPEWRLGRDERPLEQIGRVSADEVNRTSAWLAELVRERGLPPKMFVLHQFRLTMLPDRDRIVVDRPELDTLIHVDGQGGQPDKQATWRAIRAGAPDVAWGWKNFLEKDTPVLTPRQTIEQVDPIPDLITYQ